MGIFKMSLFVILQVAYMTGLLTYAHEEGGGGGLKMNRPVFDPIREDDREDFELSDIISMSLSMVYHSNDIYTADDVAYILDYHNIAKSNLTGPKLPPGSDLFFYEYNNTLAWTAFEYLRQCLFAHGWADSDNMTDLQSQNLYTGTVHHPSHALWLYYQEYEWWFFENYTCVQPYPKYQCNHWTTMSWFNASELGSARRSYCFPRERRYLSAIHYFPATNYPGAGFHVYRVGWHCTRCPRGWLCHNKLCLTPDQCRRYNVDCECRLDCQNCAAVDWKGCRCICKAGWDWEDCSFLCWNEYEKLIKKDEPKFRNFCRWFIASRCVTSKQFRHACRFHCGMCDGLNKAKQLGVCCEGKICDPYYVLDTKTCECKLRCPSRLCMHPPSTTTTTRPVTTSISTTTPRPVKKLTTQLPKKMVRKKQPPTSVATMAFPFALYPSLAIAVWLVWLLCC